MLKLENPSHLSSACIFSQASDIRMKFEKMDYKERVTSSLMDSFLLWATLVFDLLLRVSGNAEVDALKALKTNLTDPNNILQSWNTTHVNPCGWPHVTCNSGNSVTRVDLGNANLTGQLVPQLGRLTNLQYLELYSNNISGRIPDELGNLTNLVSLELYLNRLSGPIPDSLGNLSKLRFLRLNNNSLSGNIPMSLTNIASLQVIDLSNNQLTGEIPNNGSFALFTPTSFENNPGIKSRNSTLPPSNIQKPPTPSEPSPSLGNSAASSMLPISSGLLLLALLFF